MSLPKWVLPFLTNQVAHFISCGDIPHIKTNQGLTKVYQGLSRLAVAIGMNGSYEMIWKLKYGN